MSVLEKQGGRDSRSLISMAFEMSQENEILQARLKVLEAENKRLRAELDWVREKFLEVETMLWRDGSEAAAPPSDRTTWGGAAAPGRESEAWLGDPGAAAAPGREPS